MESEKMSAQFSDEGLEYCGDSSQHSVKQMEEGISIRSASGRTESADPSEVMSESRDSCQFEGPQSSMTKSIRNQKNQAALGSTEGRGMDSKLGYLDNKSGYQEFGQKNTYPNNPLSHLGEKDQQSIDLNETGGKLK